MPEFNLLAPWKLKPSNDFISSSNIRIKEISYAGGPLGCPLIQSMRDFDRDTGGPAFLGQSQGGREIVKGARSQCSYDYDQVWVFRDPGCYGFRYFK